MKMNSLISWVGGKKSIRDLIYARFPQSYGRYIEVFGGGGWVLFGKKPDKFEVYNDFNNNLSQIDFVQISYYRYSFYPSKYLVNGSGNKIVFKFNMLDGSQYIIENLVSSDKETFSKGIELMKKNGVRFVDSYHLLDIIRSNKNLDQYIVAIEKEKKHD